MRDASARTAAPPATVQRASLEQARRVHRRQLEAQRRLLRAYRHSLAAQGAAQRQAVDAATATMEFAAVAARTGLPEGGGRGEFDAAVRDAESSVQRAADEWWTRTAAALSDAAETSDGFLGAYADVADAGFEAALAATGWLAAEARPTAEPVEVAVEEVES